MKLLDTNVVVYARGHDHPYKESCKAVLADARARPGAYGLDMEALQELLDVYARRGERRYAARVVEEALVAFPDPFPVTRREIEEATDIVVGHRRLSARDAIHAAVVLTYGLEGIVSADRGFDRIAGLQRFDPAGLAAG